MELPEELEEKLYFEIKNIEVDKKVSLITYAEKRGLKEGIQQGIQEGRKEGAIIAMHRLIELLLRDKFGDQELSLIEQIKKIKSQNTLEKISLELQKSATVEEFKKRLYEANLI